MSEYRLSSRAESDLAEIADYTIERFGIEQARRYRDELESCIQTLAANPMIGRSADELGSKLRRCEHQSHIVFYLPSDQGVFVVRVLHQRMDYARHL